MALGVSMYSNKLKEAINLMVQVEKIAGKLCNRCNSDNPISEDLRSTLRNIGYFKYEAEVLINWATATELPEEES